MKLRSTLPVFGIPVLLFFLLSCTKTDQLLQVNESLLKKSNQPAVCIDIDGNSYKTIKIGNKVWMAENLRVTRYRNGQAINPVTSTAGWADLANLDNKAAWCYYDNNAGNDKPYGKLYTWYAVNDTRGIAPKGWHIPTNEEWIQLGNALGGYSVAGGKMKTTGTIEAGNGLWRAPNTSATNSSGFSAVPAGERSASGVFDGKSYRTRWWTANSWEGDAFNFFSLDINLFSNQGTLYNSSDNITSYNALAGLSVRCVKD